MISRPATWVFLTYVFTRKRYQSCLLLKVKWNYLTTKIFRAKHMTHFRTLRALQKKNYPNKGNYSHFNYKIGKEIFFPGFLSRQFSNLFSLIFFPGASNSTRDSCLLDEQNRQNRPTKEKKACRGWGVPLMSPWHRGTLGPRRVHTCSGVRMSPNQEK